MISQRELARRYARLYNEKAPKDHFNNYNCLCGHITKTVDIDEGCTPMMFDCEKCGNIARSTFYIDNVPFQEATIEWHRPTFKECMKMRRKPNELDYILSGGLAYRYIHI